jgi:gliding motility-associated-like protein
VGDTTICKGQLVTLKARKGAYIYNWNTGDLTSSITVNPKKTTTYSLRVFTSEEGAELISNHDFSKGNSGFTSDYDYVTSKGGRALWDEGKYAIGTKAKDYHAHFSACTGPSGNASERYMIVNGSPEDEAVIWSQVINVEPNKYYAFSTQACNVNPNNPAILEFRIGGVLMGDFIAPTAGQTCVWEEFHSLWHSGSNTSVEISIVNQNTIRNGNDYGLGGISFNPLVENAFERTVHVNDIVKLSLKDRYITCENNPVDLNASVSNASTVLWRTTGDGVFTNSNSVNSTYTPGTNDILNGNVTISIEATGLEGCAGATATSTIIINRNPIVDLGADRSLCSGNSLTLDAGNLGSTYLWSTGSVNQTITVNKSGIYSVQVTNANGCTSQDEVQVIVHDNPIVDLGTDRSLCSGNSLTLDAGNSSSTYLWSTGSVNQRITVNKSGTYSVQVTNANGCTSQDEVQVTVHNNPIVDLGADQTICLGNKVILDAGVSGNKYLWNTGETSQKIEIAEKTGMYSVTVENSRGCITKDSTFIEIIRLPSSPLEEKLDLCYGNSVKLDVGKGIRFLWNDGLTTPTRIVNKAGKYSVQIWDLNGCYGEDSIEVIVHDLPVVDLGPDLFICEGEELTLVAPDNYKVNWNPGGDVKTIKVNEAGTYILKATDEYGCTGKDEILIFVNKNPEVDLGNDTVIGEGSSIMLDAGSGYVTYEWSNHSNSQMINVNQSGEYRVKVSDANGCRGDGKVKVAVNPLPVINLGDKIGICQGTSLRLDAGKWEKYRWNTGETTRTILVKQPGEYIARVWDVYNLMGIDTVKVHINPNPEIHLSPDTLSFYKGQRVTLDAGIGFASYLWSTGEDWRSIEVEEAGDYSVQVSNKFGCIAKDNIHVKQLKPYLAVPNVFTPNGKGKNEIFYPVFKGVVTDFEMYVYTRWGEQVFELRKPITSNNELKSEGWNGKYKGKDAEIGVYVWIIFYGGKEQGHGTVTLFR